ncbi:MAG: FxsA family protein [Methylococcales bacterium]|nr:FxsA family protein [Methylococcales bacterium]
MRLVPVLTGAFIIVPFIEIYLLLTLGGLIGPAATIALVIFTAVLGAGLLRQQGFATLKRLQQQLDQGILPAFELIEGPMLLVGGALLLTPGFVTDAFGFALLIPKLRRQLATLVLSRGWIRPVPSDASESGRTLEGEYRKDN